MVRVTYVDDRGGEMATVELDDFTVKTLYPDIAEMLKTATSTRPQPSPRFELSKVARQRRARRLQRIKA
jgi:hypothetical protein